METHHEATAQKYTLKCDTDTSSAHLHLNMVLHPTVAHKPTASRLASTDLSCTASADRTSRSAPRWSATCGFTNCRVSRASNAQYLCQCYQNLMNMTSWPDMCAMSSSNMNKDSRGHGHAHASGNPDLSARGAGIVRCHGVHDLEVAAAIVAQLPAGETSMPTSRRSRST
jgi:hypothetical protein